MLEWDRCVPSSLSNENCSTLSHQAVNNMIDLIGQCLGQYEVTAPLGKGGMATVYRAHQLNVERDVAIKVLKPELVDNPDFIKRFEREAKLSASLSHPHILKLFDYGQQGDIIYLVTELLPGGSLADLIKTGPPLSLTRRILKQIAQALDYAHRRGIVHRDLKPQNVLFDDDGNVFLVDFGIATLLSEVAEQAQTGLIVGTPTYIAPEQWLGTEVDARTDIYALAVIVYEMLAGRPPFVGDSLDSLIQQHMHEPPPQIHTLNPNLPPTVHKVFAKALAKAQTDRYDSAVAFEEAFDEAVQGQEDGDLPFQQVANTTMLPQTTVEFQMPDAIAPESERTEARKRRIPLVAAVAVVALLLVGAAFAVLSGRAQPAITKTASAVALIPAATNTSVRVATSIPSTPTVAYTPTTAPTATITPNLQATIAAGIAMTSTVKAAIAMSEVPSTAVAGAPTPTASGVLAFASDRDGNWEIYVMDSNGQNVHNLTRNPADDTQPVWSPDGSKITFISNRDKNQEIYVMDADGQNLHNLTQNAADDNQPAWSPDGKQLAFISFRGGNAELFLMDSTGASQRLTNNSSEDSNPVWSPDGKQLAFESKRNGDIGIYVVDLDSRKERRLTKDRSDNRFPVWSPDGKQIAYISDRRTKWEIFVIDLDGKNEHNLTDNPANDIDPLWSPDGKQIAFISDRRDTWEIWLMDSNGNNPDRLTSTRRTNSAPAWSRDGKQIAFSSRTTDGDLDIYVMDAYGKNQRRLTSAKGDDTSPSWQPKQSGDAVVLSGQ